MSISVSAHVLGVYSSHFMLPSAAEGSCPSQPWNLGSCTDPDEDVGEEEVR